MEIWLAGEKLDTSAVEQPLTIPLDYGPDCGIEDCPCGQAAHRALEIFEVNE